MKQAETAFQRSRVYALLSHAFGEPAEEFIAFVRDGSFRDQAGELVPGRLHPDGTGEDLLASLTAGAGGLTADAIGMAYERLTSPKMNYLYECNYHPPLTSAVEMADVAGFYRAFGLDFSGDRPDHIASELEFMRLLAMKEAKALMDGDVGNAGICLAAQKDFLTSHLGRWTGVLSGMAEDIPFYSVLTGILRGWIAAEMTRLSVTTDELFPSPGGGYDTEIPAYCIKEASHERI